MARPDFRKDVAEEMIRQIEAGTAPWQKPWQAGVFRNGAFNPVSGTRYNGINAWWLELQGRDDPRWLTYRQAEGSGAQVRKGEKATWVEYWKWSDRRPMLDESGAPVLDGEGKPNYREVRLSRPQVFYAPVFNAAQVDGLEPYQAPTPSWSPVSRAEALVAGSGVKILLDQNDRAFYEPGSDRIRMPMPAAFGNPYDFYATQLHEIGHATGHGSRLARDFGPFGSPAYAVEELRAEMASFMLSTELGLGHRPERHAGYVESWLEALNKDRNVLFRAARDAEVIREWVSSPEKRPELERAAQQSKEVAKMTDKEQEKTAAPAEARVRVFISVPFAEKDEAKKLGARWDKSAKSWYVPAGLDAARFSHWNVENAMPAAIENDPAAEFTNALKERGLVVAGTAVMDGRWHRVPVEGDAKGQISGSYKGFLDGRANGLIMNYRTGGEVEKWVMAGEKIDPARLAELKKEAARRKAEMDSEIREKQRMTAIRAKDMFRKASPANAFHPYLVTKQIDPLNARVDDVGNLLIPMTTADGEIMNVQRIASDGTKRLLKGGKKEELMNILTGSEDGPVIIAEGHATAATVQAATGRTVVAAFDAGNLEPVTKEVHRKFPGREIVIAADNDWKREPNVGVSKAAAAGLVVNAKVAVPDLTDAEKAQGMTDFNDLRHSRGLDAVARQVGRAISAEFALKGVMFRDEQEVFSQAISEGRLSKDRNAPNWSGNYMYMTTEKGEDLFKHRDTKEYLPVLATKREAAPPSSDLSKKQRRQAVARQQSAALEM